MTERIRPSHDKDDESSESQRRPSFLQGLAEFVRDEAIDHVVNTASGGWLSYEGQDDADEPRRKTRPDSADFNARLERALAEMQAQEQIAAAGPTGVEPALPPSSPQPPPHSTTTGAASSARIPATSYRPSPALPAAPRGFGRKGI
jgi:hypothetical protein